VIFVTGIIETLPEVKELYVGEKTGKPIDKISPAILDLD
jgi:hypothetical protein